MEDYKKLYLEQRRLALSLEMQMLQMRAQMIEAEVPGVDEELKAYVDKEKEPDTDKA